MLTVWAENQRPNTYSIIFFTLNTIDYYTPFIINYSSVGNSFTIWAEYVTV